MKNLKKVLALAVAFVMCFTMFAGAAVYSDVPAGSDYSEAVSLLSDLGIIAGLPDGSFGVNQTITRADAACLIARMLTGETMPSKYAGASNFTDVPKDAYYESAVAYCAIMGITSGTSTTLGTYSPTREITDGEFIAMITRALGYDSAENPLSFPMGNIARAQQEGILDNVNVVAESPALRGEDAMMIYNALFAEYDAYVKQVNIYQGADDHGSITIAEKVFGLDRLARVENGYGFGEKYKNEFGSGDKCLAHTWVVVGVDPREAVNTYTAYPISDKTNAIDIDNLDLYEDEGDEYGPITFIYEGDPSAILGYQVELWGELDHNGVDQIIKAVKTVKGQTGYDWQLSDGEDGSKKLTVSGGTVDAKEAPIAITNVMIEDSKGDEKAYTHTDLDEWSAFDLVVFDDEDGDYGAAHKWDFQDGDSYRMVDWDSDGTIDFGIKTVRKYAEIVDIDDEDITFSGIVEGSEDEVTYEIDGDQLKFNCAGIQEGDVVELTATRAYSKAAGGEVVTVSVDRISSQIAELTKVSTKGELQMTFDGVVRELADDEDRWDLVENTDNDLNESDLEGTYEIWLDENGFIVKLIESDTNTGYLVALELEDGLYKTTRTRSERAIMKAKLDDNTVEAFEVAYDLDIVGTAYTTSDPTDGYREKRNINGAGYDNVGNSNTPLYDKTTYRWTAAEEVVGQVYKYWMDSDGIITKLQRVAESQDKNYTYWPNTGVVTVGTGATATDFNGKTFNGNVYLKNSDVLFITADNFVKHSYHQAGINHTSDHPVWADEDDVLAIEPSTANLKAISLTSSLKLANDDIGALSGSNVPLYTEDDGTTANTVSVSNGNTFYNIAYDVDKNGYATAAIMAIDNFAEFNKNTTVALITDVTAQNRKNTIFEIEGAVAGKVGTFTSVEEEGGVGKMFYYYDRADSTSSDQIVAYTDLNELRDDINDNALYAEVSLNSDGKITKVVVMTGDVNETTGALVGPNYAVVRVAAGINMEVAKAGTAAFITDNAGNNIVRYASKNTLYDLLSVQWARSFNVTGSTNIYNITNTLEKVIEGKANSLLTATADKLLNNKILTHMTAEPSIKEATAADIVSSSNKNNATSQIDKYAVMDVAFEREDVLSGTPASGAVTNGKYATPTQWTWGSIGNALDGDDAVAVFSYKKRFGETEAAPVIVLTPDTEDESWNIELNADGEQEEDFEINFETYNGAVIESAELYRNGDLEDVLAPSSGTIRIPANTFDDGADDEWKLVITDSEGNVIEQEINIVAFDSSAHILRATADSTTPITGLKAADAWSLKFNLSVDNKAPEKTVNVKNAELGIDATTSNDGDNTIEITVAANKVSAGSYPLVFRDAATGAQQTVTIKVALNTVSDLTATGEYNDDGDSTISITTSGDGWKVARLTKDSFEVSIPNGTGASTPVTVKSVKWSSNTITLTVDSANLAENDSVDIILLDNGYCEGLSEAITATMSASNGG